MKKKIMAAVLTALVLPLSGCGERTDIADEPFVVNGEENQGGCVEGCTCTGGCICYTVLAGENSTNPEPAVAESLQEEISESSGVQEDAPGDSGAQEMPDAAESTEESGLEQSGAQKEQPENTAAHLSAGERSARREQQENFVDARETLYVQANSKDKTEKINQMDRQILANNAYDFSGKNIVFIGDSITEGITSAIDGNGNFVSYVTYVNSYLHFRNVLNHGVGGRMFSTYGGDELSLDMNFSSVTNINADIIVVFAGVNDYLSMPPDKRFGNVDDSVSTAGYCGAVRSFMDKLKRYYSDRTIFFVLMYDTSKTVTSSYSDIEGQPTLNDYLEVQRRLAKEYGFNVIDLYKIGFMDCSDKESSDYYLRDGLHPKDNGNIVLGEHIAAEMSLYFGRKEID